MRATLNLLCRFAFPVLAVLGSTLTVNPILAAEPAEELKAIRDLLKKIDERMENQNTISLQMLERQKLEFSQLKNDLTQLRDEFTQARRDLADLRGRANGISSSYYGGSSPTAGTIGSSPASIKLVNTYLTDMVAVVNGAYYTVSPGQERAIPLPPGPAWYQVPSVQPFAKSTILQPGETLTLRLYPR
jgi:hypothetical protein